MHTIIAATVWHFLFALYSSQLLTSLVDVLLWVCSMRNNEIASAPMHCNPVYLIGRTILREASRR